MTEAQFEWIRVAAFALLLLPVLVANVQSSRISNVHNALILSGGVLLIAAERWVTGTWTGVSLLFWALAAALMLALALIGALPGGVAKFLIALLPWFRDWEDWAIVVTIGFIATAILDRMKSGEAPVVPGFYLAGSGVLIFAAL